MRAHSRCAAQIHDLCETNENEREIFWLDLALIRRYGGNLTLNSLFSIRKWFMLMTFRLDHLLKLFYYYCNTRDIQLTCWSIYLNVFIYLFFPNSMFSCWKVHCSIYVFELLYWQCIGIKCVIYDLSTPNDCIGYFQDVRHLDIQTCRSCMKVKIDCRLKKKNLWWFFSYKQIDWFLVFFRFWFFSFELK